MNSIPCDVVIRPNPLLADMAIATSQKFQQFDSLFTLEEGKRYPHASLYMLQLKIEDIATVEQLLAEIAAQFSPLQLEAHRYDHTTGFIDVEYAATPELVELQNKVIAALNPIRDGLREKDKPRMEAATGLKRENFEKYGYPYVGELFRPHMTLSRLKADNPDALNILGKPSEFNGAFMKLGLFEMGDNGTCIRKINEFSLLG